MSSHGNSQHHCREIGCKESEQGRNFFQSLDIICFCIICQVHRLIVVDKQQKVTGIVSLSDVLKFLVLTTHESGTDL